MSQPEPVFAKELVASSMTRVPLPIKILLVAALVIAALMISRIWSAITSADSRYDALRVGEYGMIRNASRWSDHDVVTYRDLEADTVVAAVPPQQPADRFNPLRPGDHCTVRSSTFVRIEAMYQQDVLLQVDGTADARVVPENGDCPIGTMFVANQDQALYMLRSLQLLRDQERRDRVLTHGRLPPDRSNLGIVTITSH